MSSTTSQLSTGTTTRKVLNPDMRSAGTLDFHEKLSAKIIGQERAVRSVAGFYQVFVAGMSPQGRPISNLLFLGPTGTGKTRIVEAAAEILMGDANAVIKIDCAEFQHSHEIAKLIGSPPGYLGHRETSPLLTQENLNRYHTDKLKLSFVLFDEIEKASDSLWQLLLGILDKGVLTLGDNRRVDFSQTAIFMTSNLGAREMSEMMSTRIGFAPVKQDEQDEREAIDFDKKIYHTAVEAARRKFSPEFMNRLDRTVVFHQLKDEQLRQIIEIELEQIQKRILQNKGAKFWISCTDDAKDYLLEAGRDYRYGARHLKRSLERFLVFQLSNLIASEQVRTGDMVIVDLDAATGELIFTNEEDGAFIHGHLMSAETSALADCEPQSDAA